MISTLQKQFRVHPVTLFFIVIGLVISLSLVSFGTTSMMKLSRLISQELHYTLKNAVIVNINLSKQIKSDKIYSIFCGISSDTGIVFNDVRSFINKEIKRGVTIEGEYFTGNILPRYPILEGRYYTSTELHSGEKVVLIGKLFEKFIDKESFGNSITIGNTRYKVIGILGETRGESSALDGKIVMPFTSIPSSCKEKIEEGKKIDFTLYNNKKSTYSDFQILEDNLNKIDSLSSIKAFEVENKQDVISSVLSKPSDQMLLALLIYTFALINCINLSVYWINGRRREIGIRKAFGHTNFHIAALLFKEMLSISTLSCVISFLLQYLLSAFLYKIIDYPIEISVANFFSATLFVLLTSIITTVIPAIKASKMQPINAIKL